MSRMHRRIAAAGLLAAGLAAAPAAAGEWRLDPRRCPDLVEDRIDRRVAHGPADLREDLRDARRLNCPASAWAYVPSRHAWRGPRAAPPRPPAAVYVRRDGRYVWRRPDGVYVAIPVVVR